MLRHRPGVTEADVLRREAIRELWNYQGLEYDPPAIAVAPPSVDPGITPYSLEDGSFQYWDLGRHDAIRIALTNSQVLRDLGATVILTPDAVQTIHGPAIQETDPRFGVAGALSAFDAQLSVSSILTKNDRPVNNSIQAGPNNLFRQDLFNNEVEISKLAATGALVAARQVTIFDQNNIIGNRFPQTWTTIYEGELRQPLLQGAGWRFNRVAGPLGMPGALNGVVIARLNTDISLTDYELGLRDLLSNVENAYWDLYYAYRELDAKRQARDASLRILKEIESQAGRPQGTADKIARAREQYYRLQNEVEEALSGRLVEGTRPISASTGGTFRGVPGVLVAERRLRLLLGIPINDGRLIRPSEDPPTVRVVFQWQTSAQEALERRPELHRQRLVVKRRELELLATKNYLLPRFDLVGRYRFRGFGEDLLHPDRDGRPPFDNAYMDLTTGDFQEWDAGVELSMPIGFRQAHAAVRNAQLRLSRDRAILNEQQRQIIHNLSNALADVTRAYRMTQSAHERVLAADENYQVLRQQADRGLPVDPYLLLDAQQRKADATSMYVRNLIEYAIALKNVHYEKGTLLEFNDVYLSGSEGLPAQLHGIPTGDYQVPLDEIDEMVIPDEPASPTPNPAPEGPTETTARSDTPRAPDVLATSGGPGATGTVDSRDNGDQNLPESARAFGPSDAGPSPAASEPTDAQTTLEQDAAADQPAGWPRSEPADAPLTREATSDFPTRSELPGVATANAVAADAWAASAATAEPSVVESSTAASEVGASNDVGDVKVMATDDSGSADDVGVAVTAERVGRFTRLESTAEKRLEGPSSADRAAARIRTGTISPRRTPATPVGRLRRLIDPNSTPSGR